MSNAAFKAASKEREGAAGVGEEDGERGVAVEDAGENHTGHTNGGLEGETVGVVIALELNILN